MMNGSVPACQARPTPLSSAGAVRLVDGEVRHVVADPGALLIGTAGRIPPDVALAVAPRLAVRAGRGAVVHDVSIGRPVETPAEADVVVGFATRRQVAVGGREHA